MLRKYTVGILGAGNMGEAMIRGMLRSDQTVPGRIIVSNRNATKLRHIKSAYSVRTSHFNTTVVESADIIILAVKPQDMEALCTEIRPLIRKDQVIISIAAGITIAKLKKFLGISVKLIRSMPNTPSLVDYGVTAIYSSPSVKEREAQLAEEIFGAVGLTFRISRERDMDAITALSGTGPAYIYDIIGTMTRAGRKLGIPSHLAQELITHTIIGAARMVMLTGEDPGTLWSRVASKGGTTVAAFNVLNKKGFQRILEEGVRAAAKRSRELGRL